ncbi:hypothetical protein PENTCL1PPCAC_16178, partial [Pristionchus entomophagus]
CLSVRMSSRMVILFLLAFSVAVTHGRVTFTNSEVLQQTDLGVLKTAALNKCENGCMVYTDSTSEFLFITDGEVDNINFQLLNMEPGELPHYVIQPNTTYVLEFRSEGAPPAFVLYVVDQSTQFADSFSVRPLTSGNSGLTFETRGPRWTTLLNSGMSSPWFGFIGDFEPGYPRIYTTGFDATNQEECKPVYQSRSKENVQSSRVTFSSPIITVDVGPSDEPTDAKTPMTMTNGAYNYAYPYSSMVYFSPGYVGCSYTQSQFYATNKFAVMNVFRSQSLSLDYDVSMSIPTEKEAIHVYVNGEEIHLFGDSPSITRHFDGTEFEVIMDWFRMSADSYFLIQFDFGAEVPQTTIPTTTSSAPASWTLSALLSVICFALCQ